MNTTPTPVLRARDLEFAYGARRALHGIDIELYRGDILAVVGESGSGKSTLLRMLYGWAAPHRGEVALIGDDGAMHPLERISEYQRRQWQRSLWGMVTQNPQDSLRMQFSVGANLVERRIAQGIRRYDQLRQEAMDWLARVEIDPGRIDDLPDTLSGGMLQRLQLARVLISSPEIVFLDEPTSGLDVSVQAAFLDLLRRLVADRRMTVVLVTHDLGVARLIAQRIAVMHNGRIVEAGLVDQVLDDPHHPYTQLLISAVLPT